MLIIRNRRLRRPRATTLGSDERGSVTLENVIVWPVVMIVLFGIFQVSLWLHARDVANGAATAAYYAARTLDGTTAAAESAGSNAVAASNGSINGASIAVSRAPGDRHGDGLRQHSAHRARVARLRRVRDRHWASRTVRRTMMMIPSLGRDHVRGSSTLELAIWGLPLLLFIGLLIAGGRMALAGNAVQSAAFAAAREATIARDSSQAQNAGEEGATFSLNSNGVRCASRSVAVDTSAFDQPLGTTGSVTATLTCTVSLSDAALPGLPGAVDITRSAISPVDPYRQR